MINWFDGSMPAAWQVVTFEHQRCVLFKKALDKHRPAQVSDIVISVNDSEDEYAAYRWDSDVKMKLLDRLRYPKGHSEAVIVTAKLLTGFDAPILQTMYLVSRRGNHTLRVVFQAGCNNN